MDAAEIDKELEELETKAEHLRAMYEQYFMGMERIEPLVPRRAVERRIIVLRREHLRNTAQRFKFNTLVQRFNTMQQHWARIVREIENGTYRRDVIRAAARFGEGAIAILGKKKTKDLVDAVAKAKDRDKDKRKVEDAYELGADDLVEDVEDEVDDAPTPPKLERPATPAPWAVPQGLGQGDLPLISHAAPGMGPLPQPAAPPQRSSGLRWGGGSSPDPASAIRTAPVGVQAQAPKPAAPPGFGELDLDFEEAPGAQPPRAAGPGASRPMGPLPAVSPPARPPVAQPAQPAMSGFGVLDMPLDEPPAANPSSPGSGIRPGGRGPVRPAASAAHPPAAPVQAQGDLPDQRIRQIYAKYVETKRATQESTAGVTFEKLAASLRAQANKLKSAHPDRAIDYEVVVKDGKTHLKPVLR